MIFLRLIDPPEEVKITTPSDIEEKIVLRKDFGEYTFKASAESNTTLICRGVMVTWISSTKGILRSCEGKGKGNLKPFNATSILILYKIL